MSKQVVWFFFIFYGSTFVSTDVGSRDLSEGEHAAHELQQQGLRVTAVQLDVSKPESVTQCFIALQ